MVFDGYLTGTAEEYFMKRSRAFAQKLFLWAALLMIPMLIRIAIWLRDWTFAAAFIGGFVFLFLLLYIPKSAKGRKAITPKKIFVEDDCIVCITEKYTESKFLDDVKMVRDHGEFYELVFPFGKISEKFICQKSLLTQGTPQDFEALFPGKVVSANEHR